MTTRKTWAAIVIAVLALVPPILAYLQATSESRDRAARTDREAEVGYKTLVESVRELQTTVAAQSDTIARLQGHVEAIEAVLPGGMRMTSRPMPPVTKPEFDDLPANLDAAQMKQ